MLIRDLIQLPERVQPGDYVLRLAEGVSDDAAATTLSEQPEAHQVGPAPPNFGQRVRSTEGGQLDRRFDVFQSALDIDKYLA